MGKKTSEVKLNQRKRSNLNPAESRSERFIIDFLDSFYDLLTRTKILPKPWHSHLLTPWPTYTHESQSRWVPSSYLLGPIPWPTCIHALQSCWIPFYWHLRLIPWPTYTHAPQPILPNIISLAFWTHPVTYLHTFTSSLPNAIWADPVAYWLHLMTYLHTPKSCRSRSAVIYSPHDRLTHINLNPAKYHLLGPIPWPTYIHAPQSCWIPFYWHLTHPTTYLHTCTSNNPTEYHFIGFLDSSCDLLTHKHSNPAAYRFIGFLDSSHDLLIQACITRVASLCHCKRFFCSAKFILTPKFIAVNYHPHLDNDKHLPYAFITRKCNFIFVTKRMQHL